METITHNKDKNGIEINFDYHITDETKAWFRTNAFRWSKRGNVWWRPFSEEMWTKVHEYFKKIDVPKIVPNTVCDVCGKLVAVRGIGSHKRLKHGIVVKRVMTTVKNGVTIQQSIRPSAHVPVKVVAQEIKVQPAPFQRIPEPVPEVKKLINSLAPGISVVDDKGYWIYSQMCKCGDYSIEKYRELEKIFESK